MQQNLAGQQGPGRLLSNFHSKGKVAALVCHGPIALMSTLDDPGHLADLLAAGQAQQAHDWIYAGYRFTVISNAEEEQAKALLQGGEMKFYPQTALEQAGGRFSCNAKPRMPRVVADRELITGQNPASAALAAAEILRHLD